MKLSEEGVSRADSPKARASRANGQPRCERTGDVVGGNCKCESSAHTGRGEASRPAADVDRVAAVRTEHSGSHAPPSAEVESGARPQREGRARVGAAGTQPGPAGAASWGVGREAVSVTQKRPGKQQGPPKVELGDFLEVATRPTHWPRGRDRLLREDDASGALVAGEEGSASGFQAAENRPPLSSGAEAAETPRGAHAR